MPTYLGYTLEIFTDCSINPRPQRGQPGYGGFGLCFWSDGCGLAGHFPGWRGMSGSLGMRDNTDIAEVLALSEALLLFLTTHGTYGDRFAPATFDRLILRSDSHNALQDIEWFRADEEDYRGWEIETVVGRIRLVEALGVEVRLDWVPGHSGVPGNDFADDLAARGTEMCWEDEGRAGRVEYAV